MTRKTTTSPSGHHLGIYKTLGKHVIEKNKNDSMPPTLDHGSMKQGHNVLYMIFDIMSVSLQHTYPLKR